MALLEGRPRQVSIITLTSCRLLELRAGDFHRLLAGDPRCATAYSRKCGAGRKSRRTRCRPARPDAVVEAGGGRERPRLGGRLQERRRTGAPMELPLGRPSNPTPAYRAGWHPEPPLGLLEHLARALGRRQAEALLFVLQRGERRADLLADAVTSTGRRWK